MSKIAKVKTVKAKACICTTNKQDGVDCTFCLDISADHRFNCVNKMQSSDIVLRYPVNDCKKLLSQMKLDLLLIPSRIKCRINLNTAKFQLKVNCLPPNIEPTQMSD